MNGKRIFKRVQLIAALVVLHPDTAEPIGTVNDINAEGVGVRSRQPFVEGRMYALHVQLPVEIHGHSVLELPGVCAWCRPTGTPGLHDSGFIFAGILQDSLEVIEELMRRYHR